MTEPHRRALVSISDLASVEPTPVAAVVSTCEATWRPQTEVTALGVTRFV